MTCSRQRGASVTTLRSLARSWALLSWGLLSWALGCGPASAVDVGVDYAPEDIIKLTPAPGATLPPSEASDLDLLPDDQSPYCKEEFMPCGGLIAGRWEMLETCNQETRNTKALEIWGQAVMDLDIKACREAVKSVKSDWTGQLVFEMGGATDQRMRTDTVEMMLTRGCLNATYDVTIRAERMDSVCSTLTNSTRSCIAVGDACSCSSRRESDAQASGTYAVLKDSVAIGDGSGNLKFFEYCVHGDQMLWRDEVTRRLMAMRRLEATDSTDPPFLGVR